VSYAEALCWIYFRDVEVIAGLDVLADERRDYAEMGSGMVEAILAMTTGADDWRAAAPELALQDALEAGTVTASAHPFVLLQLTGGTHHARTDRRNLTPIDWLDVRFYDAPPPFDKATTAYPKALPHGSKAGGGYTDIWFSRADLTQAFPGEGANQVVQLATARDVASAPSQTDFMRSAAALADAVSELRAEGAEVGKLAILRKVAAAFHAAGYAKPGQTEGSVFESMKARSRTVGLDLAAMLRKAAKG
jgi:hypothetical protein